MDLKREQIDAYLKKEYPSWWAMKYKKIKNKKLTFTSKTNPFANRPWQEEILNDKHPNKIVQKSRQVGMSELAVTEVLWFADMHKNVNIMYTFPTEKLMQDFSKSRVDPVIKASEYLSSKIDRGVDSVTTKALQGSYFFMRTSGDGSQGEGADIDMYCADEYDRMKPGVELAFTESLSSSKYGLMRRWSTPTLPGMGINKLYDESDQKTYLHKCQACGQWQEITEESIKQVKDGIDPVTKEIAPGTFLFVCKKCNKELDRWAKGEWVAKRPSVKDIRGYYISQLNQTYISADEIMKKQNSYAFKQLFYNYVIGRPYQNVGLQVTEADVRNHVIMAKEELNRSDNFVAYVAGIDWGEPSWVLVIGIRPNNALQVVAARKFQRSETRPLYDAKQVISFLQGFNPNLIVADAGYGADKNTELFRAFPQATFTCTWKTIQSAYSDANFLDKWQDKTKTVRVDKTTKMQRTLQAVKMGYIGFYEWANPMTQLLALHLGNVQILDKEQDGIVYQQATRKGDDHLACCLAYALIGVDRITQYGLNVSQGYSMEVLSE